jgi:hypothetical protein
MKNLNKSGKTATQVQREFMKEMKDIEANKAAKAIEEIWDGLSELSDWDAE